MLFPLTLRKPFSFSLADNIMVYLARQSMVRPREWCERPQLDFVRDRDRAREKTIRKRQVFWCRVLEWDL